MFKAGRRGLTKEQLLEGIAACGVRGGDILVVHSSLKAVGWIDQSPVTLLRAFQDLLGPRGTLVMPTFSFNLQDWGLGPFDPLRTPSRVGRLTEVFRLQPGVCRSLHPTHSVAAWGRWAKEIVGVMPEEHDPLGIGSPLDRARERGARIMLLGVGQNRNSSVHLAEHLAGVPYLEVPFSETADFDAAWYVPGPGECPKLLRIMRMPGSSGGFGVLDELLVQTGVASEGWVGKAPVRMMEAPALCDRVRGLLERNADLLLRHDSSSAITRRRLRYLYGLRPELRPESLAG